MRYREFAPAPELRRWVRCYWLLSGPPAPAEGPAEVALPDGCAELIFNLADPFEARPPGSAGSRQPAVVLVGQITGPMTIGPTGRVEIVAVRFEPWGASLLRPDQRELTDRWIDADALEIRGLSGLGDRLASARSDPERVVVLDRVLGTLARDASPTLPSGWQRRRSAGATAPSRSTR